MAPPDGRGTAHKRPWWDSTIERLIDKPMPMPWGFVVKNGLKICLASFELSPTPQSSTRIRISIEVSFRRANQDLLRRVSRPAHRVYAIHDQIELDLLQLDPITSD